MRAKPPAPDGHALWQRVAETVRSLKGKRPVDLPLPGGERVGVRGSAAKPRVPPPRSAILTPALSLKGEGAKPGDTLDGGWDRRLRRGVVAPDMTIDLHGHTLLSAQAELDAGLA